MQKSNIKIILDGSNIAHFKNDNQGKPQIKNIIIALKYFEELNLKENIEFEILIDAALRHKIDDKSKFEKLIKQGKIIQCPKGEKADLFIIEYLKIHPSNTFIVSNDMFEEFNLNTDLRKRRLNFIIIFDELIIPKINMLLKEEKIILPEKIKEINEKIEA
ncbi:MAG: NYN domain-containing protein [Promethearchaeota archaeon]